ncbi:hypothetical protein [Ornithinimicrobium kibberense]
MGVLFDGSIPPKRDPPYRFITSRRFVRSPISSSHSAAMARA